MKTTFLTQKGPKAGGPYSTAVLDGTTAYLSGITGNVPETGKLAEGGTVAEARQVLENIRTVLAEMGLTTANVLKTTVFLKDIADFAAVNKVYAEYFGPDFPARSCVQVAALPGGASVEIECVATRSL